MIWSNVMPGIQAAAANAITSCFNQSACSIIKFYSCAQCICLPRAIIAAPRCRGERQQPRSYCISWHFEGQCQRCKRAGDFDSMKTASSAGSGRTCLLQPNRLWRKPAACKVQDDLYRQSPLMQSYRWEKTWSYEKLEMKTKQSFVKTFQKKVRGVGILVA